MSTSHSAESRRRFLKLAAGTAAVAVVGGAISRRAFADDLPHVSDADPTAKALNYVEDAKASKDPKYKPGDTCANCQFYSGAAAGFGPCELFPGKSVAAKGWCMSHTAKA